MVLLKLAYQSPRPFWSNFDVQVFKTYKQDNCEFSFVSPSTQMFNLYFFYGYSIFMYFVKYRQTVNWYLVYSLYALLGVVIGVVTFGLYIFGLIYMQQAAISFLYSMVFTLACISYDDYIVSYCEKIGFILVESRQKKFEVLFFCLIGLFFSVIFYNLE